VQVKYKLGRSKETMNVSVRMTKIENKEAMEKIKYTKEYS
jgi:hypothetical protein